MRQTRILSFFLGATLLMGSEALSRDLLPGMSFARCRLTCLKSGACANEAQGKWCVENCESLLGKLLSLKETKEKFAACKADYARAHAEGERQRAAAAAGRLENLKKTQPVTPGILAKLSSEKNRPAFVTDKNCFDCTPPKRMEEGTVYYHGGIKEPAHIYDKTECKCVSADKTHWEMKQFTGNHHYNQGQ